MTESGTKTLIGAFVLGAIALATVIVLLVGSGTFDSKKSTSFVLYFDASLRGLSQGSPVYFKGVRVGRVSSIRILADDPSLMFKAPVFIELDNTMFADRGENDERHNEDLMGELIRKGLRAKLGMQSVVTGQLTVDLDMYPDAAPVYPDSLPRFNQMMQIPTIPSSLDAALDVFSRFPLEEISSEILILLRQVNVQISGMDLPALTESITLTSSSIREEVKAFAQVRAEARMAIAGVSNLARALDANVSARGREFSAVLVEADKALIESRKAMSNAGSLLREDSAVMLELSQTLRALRESAAAISQLATLLELKPDALLFGRGR